MKCKFCQSEDLQSRGTSKKVSGIVHVFHCKSCGRNPRYDEAPAPTPPVEPTPTPEVEPLVLRDRDRQIAKLKEGRASDAKLIAALEVEAAQAHKRGEVLEALRSAPKNGQPFKVKPISEGNEATAVIVLSDTHIEERVDLDKVNGLNEYNPEIARARIERVMQGALIMVKQQQREIEINTIVLAVLGDIITGYIHEDLVETNYLSPIQACILAREILTNCIELLVANTKCDIVVVCTQGNHGRCHDDQTELLTRRGWKKYNEIIPGESVATYKMDGGVAEWQNLTDLYIDTYSGPMIKVKTASDDWLVTPRHRMVTCSSYKGKAGFVEMGELDKIRRKSKYSSKYFPKTAEGHNKEYHGVTDDELRLLGWVITDGCSKFRGPRGTCPAVTIHQSKPKMVEKIRALLIGMGLDFHESSRVRDLKAICGRMTKTIKRAYTFSLRPDGARRVLALLPDKHVLPDWFWNLSQRQVYVLMDAVIDGDGARSTKGGPYLEIHGTKSILDQFQSLFMVNGVSSRVRTSNRGDAVLSVRHTKKCYINDWEKSVKTVPYTGTIWCGTVPNGTLITRRNGIPLISGNTTEKRRIQSYAENSFEYLLYRTLEAHYSSNKRVTFRISEAYHNYLDVYGYIVRFHHGDFMSYGGGVGGITIPVNKSIAQWNQAVRADLDVFGHWHQLTFAKNFISNGSTIGFNQYALSIKAGFEPPQQAFFLIDKKRKRYTLSCPLFTE